VCWQEPGGDTDGELGTERGCDGAGVRRSSFRRDSPRIDRPLKKHKKGLNESVGKGMFWSCKLFFLFNFF
jgi:hypothetical protein